MIYKILMQISKSSKYSTYELYERFDHLYLAAFAFSVLTLVLAYLISTILKRAISNLQQRNINIIYFVFAILTPVIIGFYNSIFIEPTLIPGPFKGAFKSLQPKLLIFSFITYILTVFIIYKLKRIKTTTNRFLRIFKQFIIACLLFLFLISALYGIEIYIELSKGFRKG
jgi:hypothetical protein